MFKPESELGILTGMVSTFIPPFKKYNIRAVIFFSEKISDYRDVAVSLSLTESLLIPFSIFNTIIENYAQFTYPNLLFKNYEIS